MKKIDKIMLWILWISVVMVNIIIVLHLLFSNGLKDGQLSVIGSSIGGIISGVLTLAGVRFTLTEMEQQRQSTYKPDLVLSNRVSFNIFSKEIQGIQAPEVWSIRELEVEELEGLNAMDSDIKIELYNIGKGAAKSVEINWEFDLQTMVNEIKSIDENNHYDLGLENGILMFKVSSGEIGLNTKHHKYVFNDYILPTEVVREIAGISIPKSYLNLMSMFIHLSRNDRQFEEKFPLQLSIKFLDIGGKEYYLKYLVDMNLYFVIYGKNAHGVFDIKNHSYRV